VTVNKDWADFRNNQSKLMLLVLGFCLSKLFDNNNDAQFRSLDHESLNLTFKAKKFKMLVFDFFYHYKR